jgi:hypothetical protein
VTADGVPALAVRTGFGFAGEHLRWHVGVRNLTSRAIEIGDIALPLRMNTGSADTPSAIYEQRVIKHHFVGGQGSFLYWTRPNGVGPFLTMTPDLGTRLEFSELTDQVRDVAEYSRLHPQAVKGGLETRGTWRHPHTSDAGSRSPRQAPLASSSAGRAITTSARCYAARPSDVRVVPGMTMPIDLAARWPCDGAHCGAHAGTRHRRGWCGSAVLRRFPTRRSRLTFLRLGENWVDVRDAAGRSAVGVLRDRAARRTKEHAVPRDAPTAPASGRWYDGLFGVGHARRRAARARTPTGVAGGATS